MSFKRLNQAGDTIIEVMIVLAVLGLAFTISYATANQGLQQARNAEEHSEALGLLNSQVEDLRAALSQGILTAANQPSGQFCMVSPEAFSNDYSSPSGVCTNFVAIPGEAYGETVKITYNTSSPPNFYNFQVTWPGIGDLGTQQEDIAYIINPISGSGAGFCDDGLSGSSNNC